MNRAILLTVLAFASASAYALDVSDVGTYAVVHRDGHVTDFKFFASLSANQWKIEQKNPDGSWSSVTCQKNCILRESDKSIINRFFPANILNDIDPSCVHNSAFAFCNFTSRSRPGSKSYVMIALVTPQPTPVWLKKLSGERHAP